MRFAFVASFALLAVVARPARASSSIRCRGSLVSLGASKVELLGKCGEPAHQESHEEQRSTFTGDPVQQTTTEKRVTLTVERWTYDFGSGDFIKHVAIENGKIVSITEGGYGSARGRTAAASRIAIATCDPLRDLSLGDNSDDVLSRCGEPASRELKRVEIVNTAADATGAVSGASTTVEVEVWSYNFGASSFTRQLHVRDGKVVKIITGGYGFGG